MRQFKWDDIITAIGSPVRAVIGWDLEYIDPLATPAPKTMYGEVTGISGLMLTNAAALIISQQNATVPPNCWLDSAYVGVVALCFGGLVIMVNLKTNQQTERTALNKSPRHAFDRGSIAYARFAMAWVIVIPAIVFGMVRAGAAPGQTFSVQRPAEIGMPQVVGKELNRAIMVPIPLGGKLFPNGVPEQLNLQLTLSPEMVRKWTIEQVVGYYPNKVEPKTKKMKRMEQDDQPSLLFSEKNDGTYVYFLDHLKRDEEYLFKAYLVSKDGTLVADQDFMATITSIRDGKAMNAVFLTKSKK